jgi:hypothetical protein
MGAPRDFSTRTTAGASGPLGEVERRPRPRPFKAAALVVRPRGPLRVSFGTTVGELGGVGFGASWSWSTWSSSDCKRSMRS